MSIWVISLLVILKAAVVYYVWCSLRVSVWVSVCHYVSDLLHVCSVSWDASYLYRWFFELRIKGCKKVPYQDKKDIHTKTHTFMHGHTDLCWPFQTKSFIDRGKQDMWGQALTWSVLIHSNHTHIRDSYDSDHILPIWCRKLDVFAKQTKRVKRHKPISPSALFVWSSGSLR